MRDDRHLNKFLYILGNELFYEPLEKHYKNRDEYANVIKTLLADAPRAWRVSRDGFWIHANPQPEEAGVETPEFYPLPKQGWKVHVSATLKNDLSILERVARVAMGKGVPFKFALDRDVYSLMTSKVWARGGSGKFMTLYPRDVAMFKDLLEFLYAELEGEEGPYILSDRRYKDCRVLYYRYGGMQPIQQLEVLGTKTLTITDPNGNALPDVRLPYFEPPAWAPDPFPTAGSTETEEATGNTAALKNGRYEVTQALAFSNSGGVYLARDLEAERTVVLKEARAHTLLDRQGNDAVRLLQKEQAILELLQGKGIAAEPLDSFTAWENFFLVQEYLPGLDIREIMLTRTPLMKVEPTQDYSREYYEIYRRLFTSFARGLGHLHEQGVVFGDLSVGNFKVEAESWGVRFFDFEGAYRQGMDEEVFLFTPGFKREQSIRAEASGFDEDLYAMGALMLYLLFPIAALGSLRKDDLFATVLSTMLDDLGWTETPVLQIVQGLTRGDMTCDRLIGLLAEPVEILAPSYREGADRAFAGETAKALGSFLLASIRPGAKDQLFASDPFAHRTNPLSLGFGASGVLYSLSKCGFEVPRDGIDWLERKLDDSRAGDLAPGLLTGTAGIAWCLWELGLQDRAADLMATTHASPLLLSHPSYLYGMAGVGLANLFFYLRTREVGYLERARDLATALTESAHECDRGMYFGASDEDVKIGFGYGQSGVALFFLRLYEVTGNESYLELGQQMLDFDLAHAMPNPNGGVAFPGNPSNTGTLLCYLEEGSAGVARVTMRYGLLDRLRPILRSVHRKYAVFSGLLYGLGSFVDVLTDAYRFSGDREYLAMAERPASGIRDLYLFQTPRGLAVPGDGLFRVSCDYATGVAGVMRVLHRYRHLDAADFVLDDIDLAGEDISAATAEVLAGSGDSAVWEENSRASS